VSNISISTPSRSPASSVSSSDLDFRLGPYRVHLARTHEERLAALRLRFLVFHLEWKEGLESASCTGYDTDEFDSCCDHLVVKHVGTGMTVGTYRLQTGSAAKANLGYYSEREFDFTPYEPLRKTMVELGRACIHRDHRSTEVLTVLWRGIAQYAVTKGGRYLIGCSSLTSQDPAAASAAYACLSGYLVCPALRTAPQPEFAMPPTTPVVAFEGIPKLLRTYLAIGSRICGPPALDREFKTIDFLTLLDLQALHPRIRARFFRL
jgi:putative hemolysin